MLSLTDMFASFGAPLANQRWSWGSIRPGDGATFLRVWQDECGKINGRRAVRVTATDYFSDKPENLGYAERLRHIDHIRSGRPVFLVMCAAVDTTVEPRSIAHFNDREVFVGGELIHHDGDFWIELIARRPVSEVRPNNSLGSSRGR